MRALVAISFAFAIAASTALQADSDPWTRVPALPTACYQSDGYADKLAAAGEALERDAAKQKAINDGLQDQLRNMDPMQMAQKQQQYMMAHPEEAMKLMERNAALGTQEASDARMQSVTDTQKLMQDLDGIDARYETALDTAFAPIVAKFDDLDARASKDLELTEAGGFYKPWAVEEWNALNEQRNKAYEKVCAEWWASSGPYHGWLASYREHLAAQIPVREEADAVGAGFMVMIATPEAEYRPTVALDVVRDYIEQTGKVFAKRWAEPGPPQQGIGAGSR